MTKGLLAPYAALLAVRLLAQAPVLGPFDLVLANGRAVGHEPHPDAGRHVRLSGGVVRAVSATPIQGRASIDARGLVVAPGFIDLHQHGQTSADYVRKAADGVTTALELEVGTANVDAWYA